MSINAVVLTGRLTRDPEMDYSRQGTPICNFGIAVDGASNESDPDRQGAYKAGFFDCIAFGNTAEFVQQYLDKGSRVGIDGRLRQDRWKTDSGDKRSRVKIVVGRVDFQETRAEADARRAGQGTQGSRGQQQQRRPAQDDAPFGDDDALPQEPDCGVDPEDDPFGDQ